MLESFEAGSLKLTLRYSWIVGNSSDLMLNFPEVRAIRTFWDGDGERDQFNTEPPRCAGERVGYIWPLLEIESSRWMESSAFSTSMAIAQALGQEPWRHYQVITLERSLDILARGTVTGVWLPGSA
jgi:hypothetical protein